MPQPNKKRGRRMGGGKKRKHEDAEEESLHDEGGSSKRRRSEVIDGDGDGDAQDDGEVGAVHADSMEPTNPAMEKPFFGMLDEDEQEYFKRADSMLESNAFGEDKERALFLANVYKEADGKELKIAQSQSCSRLMERLVQLSTPEQLKALFVKFRGNFIHLVSHRFASHCCEALFLRSAPVVTSEFLAGGPSTEANADDGDAVEPMEKLFLETLSELEGDLGFLLTDRYASHVLRVLLLVLSGEPVDIGTTKHLLQSKRKEANTVQGHEFANVEALSKSRTVPESFSAALEKIIVNSIAGLDTDQLRTLATHPNANPTLQLLLKLELSHLGKQRAKDEKSITRTLLPDDPITHDCESAKFISGLVYDPIGSHLVEQIVQHAPGKMFKSLYSEFFKERLASHARNEIAGYVACRVLERLGHDDLLEAHEVLIPHISDLLRKNRTMVVRTLIERCVVRDIDTQAIAVQVDSTWHGQDGFEIKTLLKYNRAEADEPVALEGMQMPDGGNGVSPWSNRETAPVKAHFNVLAQAMLLVPGSLSALVLDSLVGLDPSTLLNMAKDHIVSRTLQAALTTRNASMITTRKLIQHFYGHMGEMALDIAASHVVDCIWQGTHGLAFIRERVAEELAENEAQLRESSCGRAVWKNWKMDLYKRRRMDWVKQSKVKASNDGFQSFAELDINKDKTEKPKTALELARERHARKKSKGQSQGGSSKSSKKSSRSRSGSARVPAAATATAPS